MNALIEYLNSLKHQESMGANSSANREALFNMMPQPVQNALTTSQQYLSSLPDTGLSDYMTNRFNQSRDYFQNEQPQNAARNRAALSDFFMRMAGR